MILLREVLEEIYLDLEGDKPELYQQGNIFVVNVYHVYKKCKILLTGSPDNIPTTKHRPIIIFKKEGEKICFFGLSSNENFRGKKFEFPIKECNIPEKNCKTINFKTNKKIFIFIRKNKRKRKYLFWIDEHAIENMKEENLAKYCGKCDKSLIEESIKNITSNFN